MKILLVGCGKMGSAMAHIWKEKNIGEIRIVDPVENKLGFRHYKSIDEIKDYSPDTIVLAIKPQSFDEVLPQLSGYSNVLFISIAPGKTIASIQKHLPNAKVIRAMPNLPVIAGSGVIGLFTNLYTKIEPHIELNSSNAEIIKKLFYDLGYFIYLKSENQIDAITALSGSGPAYVALFAQSMKEIAIDMGFDERQASRISSDTIKGTIKIAENYKDENGLPDFIGLKSAVASKGGTTEAALKVLEKNDAFKKLLTKAINAAKIKSEEL